MKSLYLTVLIVSIAATISVSGCSASETQQQQPDQPLPVSENLQETSDVAETLDPVTEALQSAALDFMETLGYDTVELTVDSIELLPVPDVLLWRVHIGYMGEEIAVIDVFENSGEIKYFLSQARQNPITPQQLAPADGLPLRIAEMIGLEEQGYVLSEWISVTDEYCQFRFYETVDDFSICTRTVVIAAASDITAPLFIDFLNHGITSPVEINIDRDEALSLARESLGSDAEIVNVELVSRNSDPMGLGDSVIFWEVSITGSMTNINAETGEFE